MTISTIYYISIISLFICKCLSFPFKNKKLVTCILCGLILGVLLGLRNPYLVGVDGLRYGNTYQNLYGEDASIIFQIKGGNNLLFYFVNWILSNLGLQYQYFTMLCGFFCAFVISMFIYHFSSMPLLSYLLYLGLGFYTFAFSGQKEALAMAFILLSYLAMYEGRNIKSWAYFVIAVLMHYTAIVFLPIILIGKIKISKRMIKNLALIFFPVLIVIVYNRLRIAHWLTSTFAEHYVGRYEIGGAIGGTAVFAIIFTVLFLLSSNVLNRSESVSIDNEALFFERSLLYICIAASIVQLLSSYAYAYTRLAFYYLQFFTISIPYIFQTIKVRKLLGRYYILIMAVIMIVLFVLMISQFFGHIEAAYLQDYKFMWE